jgi:hypothetical protein
VRWLLCVAVACSSSAKPVEPPPKAPPIAKLAEVTTTGSCVEAATGLERGTKGLREPETTVLDLAKQQCEQQVWSEQARRCFTTMREGELEACVKLLEDKQRAALMDTLGATPRVRIALALARLDGMQVGVPECDKFIVAVSAALNCEHLPLDQRAELAAETVDFWSLPVQGLPEDAALRMATACGESRASLEAHATAAGCP